MSPSDDLIEAARSRERDLIEVLSRWVEIPSISTGHEHGDDVRRSAEFLRERALEAGFTRAEVLETAGQPSLYAERIEDAALPTVLVYGHHDVQPVDPLSEWVSPPFEPRQEGGLLFGRGTADDKGQLVMHLEAVRALLDARGRLPVNLKLIAEGEEEDGSDHFAELVRQHRERLAADVAVISDTGMPAPDVPALTVGLRGLAYWELRLQSADTDLHSGVYGGAVLNPIAVLAGMLAQLHDSRGRVAIPGFYDAVRELGDTDREQIAEVPFDPGQFAKEVGAVLGGEEGFTAQEQRTARPTLEICGIWGGYQGEGSKTVIPSRAFAKLSSRLVADQDPDLITQALEVRLRGLLPSGVRMELETLSTGAWVLSTTDHPAVAAAAEVLSQVWGSPTRFIREGGSIPPVAVMAEQLGVPCVLLGVALPTDRFHAPNERVSLDQLFKGVRALVLLWERYGELGREGLRPGPGRPGPVLSG